MYIYIHICIYIYNMYIYMCVYIYVYIYRKDDNGSHEFIIINESNATNKYKQFVVT